MSGQGRHEEGIILFPSTLALNWFKTAIKAYVHKGEVRVLQKVEAEECLEEGSSLCRRELGLNSSRKILKQVGRSKYCILSSPSQNTGERE